MVRVMAGGEPLRERPADSILKRQSHWIHQSGRSKSIRPPQDPLAPPYSHRKRLSINHKHSHNHHLRTLTSGQGAARMAPSQEEAAAGAQWGRTKTTEVSSGNQPEISAQMIGPSVGPKPARVPRRATCSALQVAISIGLIGLILAQDLLLCTCDTPVASGLLNSNGLNWHGQPAGFSGMSNQNENQDGAPVQTRRSGGDETSSSSSFVVAAAAAAAAATPSSQKELFRAAWADNIERQKLIKLAPSFRALALARPSKFDSDSESLQESETATSKRLARLHARSPTGQPVKTLDDIMNQHLGGASRKPTSASASSSYAPAAAAAVASSSTGAGSKADQGMRQIMMLHEQATAVSTHGQPARKPEATAAQAAHQPQSSFSKQLGKKLIKPILGTHSDELVASLGNKTAGGGASKLWSLAAQPLLAAGATKSSTATGKVLSNVISYLASPIMTLGSPAALAATRKQQNFTNPFTARTNAKSLLVAPLLGLGQMLAAPDGALPASSGGGKQKQSQANKYSMPVGSASADNQASYVLSNAINQPQGYTSSLKGLMRGTKPGQEEELAAEASGSSSVHTANPSSGSSRPSSAANGHRKQSSWIKALGANQLAQSYIQNSLRDLLTLTQLPILSNGPASTAPSELEPGGKKYAANRVSQQQQPQQGNKVNTTLPVDDLFRYAYILANLGVRRKRDPLKVLGSTPPATAGSLMLTGPNKGPFFTAIRNQLASQRPGSQSSALIKLPGLNVNGLLANRKIKPRGVMWDMATDPSLAVTMFHLLERVSVALPLGFLLMPLVQMMRNPLNGINLGRIIPARASHRSVDYEELAKRIDMMDKILSRALRPSHREAALSLIKR